MEAVVAFDLELGIGKDGGLPWHIPSDLAKFKELTMGKTVVMGRRTWESLPESVRPLPGRQNVVVSRNGYFGTDAWRAPSIEAVARNFPDAMVIGGGQLYKALLPHIDVIHASVVEGVWGCDTFFPALDGFAADYVEVHPDFTTVKYVRA